MTVWYLHGAGASSRSFAWLRGRFPDHVFRDVEYDITEPADQVAARLAGMIAVEPGSASLVGHSLGGLIALAAAAKVPVRRIATLAAPLGGSSLAGFMRWVSDSPLFESIRPHGAVVRAVRGTPVTCPVLSVVATRGLPFLPVPNDGVIAVSSQTALNGPFYHRVDVNHFEVLLDQGVADLLRDFLF